MYVEAGGQMHAEAGRHMQQVSGKASYITLCSLVQTFSAPPHCLHCNGGTYNICSLTVSFDYDGY